MPASLPRKHRRVSAWLRRIYLHFCIGPIRCPFSRMAAHRKSDRRPRWSLRGADFVIYACYDASRSRLRCRRVLTCLVESKPNSTMIKTNTISVMLMATSIIDKKSPKPPWREEHREMDLRRRTRRKSSSPSFGQLDLCSWYFLKNSNPDIS